MRSICLTIWLASALAAQVRPLHTRDLTRLSHPQIAEQLKRSDVIFIPVGAVEANGIQPTGRDYVWPLGYAMAAAEATGGLYLPGLVWSFPGTTRPAASTVHLTPSAGVVILKELAHSLLKQGFRRQVYISASHGPAPLTLGTLVREFFEETQTPILYLDMGAQWRRLNVSAEERQRALYGVHEMAGRLEDLPLAGEYAETPLAVPENKGLAALNRLGLGGSLQVGSWIADEMAHGGGGPLPKTAAERAAWAQEGAAAVRRQIAQLRLGEAMAALAEHDRFTREVVTPKFRERLAPRR